MVLHEYKEKVDKINSKYVNRNSDKKMREMLTYSLLAEND